MLEMMLTKSGAPVDSFLMTAGEYSASGEGFFYSSTGYYFGDQELPQHGSLSQAAVLGLDIIVLSFVVPSDLENDTAVFRTDPTSDFSGYNIYVNGMIIPDGAFVDGELTWDPAPPELQFQDGQTYLVEFYLK